MKVHIRTASLSGFHRTVIMYQYCCYQGKDLKKKKRTLAKLVQSSITNISSTFKFKALQALRH